MTTELLSQFNLNGIVTMMEHAHSVHNVKFPTIRLPLAMDGNHEIELKRAGAKSRYTGAVNITDGKPYGQNEWYGRISTEGKLQLSTIWQEKHPNLCEMIICTLHAFDEDPQTMAKTFAEINNHCCFCNTVITNKVSLANGYGPICARNYGLPYANSETGNNKLHPVKNYTLETALQEQFNLELDNNGK